MRIVAALLTIGISGPALAQENYESWRLHTSTFGSTGGNGVMIGEYNPVISGNKCTTDFTATLADGKFITTRSSSTPCRSRAAFCAPTGAGAAATARAPVRHPIGCSSKTV
jgi:hypothetical protein